MYSLIRMKNTGSIAVIDHSTNTATKIWGIHNLFSYPIGCKFDPDIWPYEVIAISSSPITSL